MPDDSGRSGPPKYLGYRDPAYARSLAQFGVPRELPSAGGWVIERSIAGTDARDAMGPYPLFSCEKWHALPDELRTLRAVGLVSVVLVTDSCLLPRDQEAFSAFDLVRTYKTHFCADLERPLEDIVSRHHRYYLRKAARALEVDVSEAPLEHLDEWFELHEHLRARHDITQGRAFSRASFATLLAMPGVVMLRALAQGRAVGAEILLRQDDVAHAHLASFSADGYRLGASYLLDWEALRYCQGRARYLNWGGGAGHDAEGSSGLARYKQGWSNEQRQSYLLGAVLDRSTYASLAARHGAQHCAYFPAYRAGEFA